MTLTTAAEAVGIVRVAVEVGLPAVISFTVETDGRLPDGQSLPDAASAFVLDAYEVAYPGIARPLRVYIDDNHWVEPQAPLGLACGVPIRLQKIGG